MKQKKQKVSIIVPIYDVEKYLLSCIDSILSQTYPYIEIILIDDGSPDQCGNICDKKAIFDDRIRVIHKKMEAYLVQETSDWNLQQANILYLLILMIRYMRDL